MIQRSILVQSLNEATNEINQAKHILPASSIIVVAHHGRAVAADMGLDIALKLASSNLLYSQMPGGE